MKLLILAGGSGTRLWPLSRAARPKQVQPFLDGTTLLQRTWMRLRQAFPARDIFVSTTAGQLKLVRQQLPHLHKGNVLVEPKGRNTGPAIGFAAKVFAHRFPKEVVATINSDHFIGNNAAYLRSLKMGERAVRSLPEQIVLLGVRPTYPETGYGYIESGSRVPGSRQALRVIRFTEKPSLVRARGYLRKRRYLWNSGLFLFYPTNLLGLMDAHAPLLARGLRSLHVRNLQKGRAIASRAFASLPAVSLDYAVLEKTKKLAVLPASFGWSDVGHWRAVYDILAPSAHSNIASGLHIGLGSQGNLVYAPPHKLVATIGLSNTVIIDAGDALLVCPRSVAQNVRGVVNQIKQQPKLKRFL